MSLFDDASLVLTPNGYKASKLYSIKPTSGLGDMVVSRGTTATRVNSSNVIESVAINVPRLDYTLGSCPSILVEPERINRLFYSEQFNQANWAATNVTITANAAAAPDNNTTADKFIPTIVNSVHFIQQPGLPSNAYTFSVFAKAGGETTFSMWLVGGSKKAEFDLSTGTNTANSLGVTAKIEAYPNGWYRCSMYNASAGTDVRIYGRGGSSFTGNGVDGIFLWGAQAEATTVLNPTSYIPTVAATVTRNADVISKTGVSSLIGQTEGTLYAEINISTFNYGIFFSINDGTSANRIQMYKFTDNKIYCDRQSATQSATTSISSSALSVGTYKVAFAYQSGTSYLYINGAQVGATSAATFTFGSMGKVNIGSRFDDINTFNDRVELATLFQTRLTPQQCIDLTTP
jgi:hypothetical protein